MIFVGIDWSETHHDVCAMDADGKVLAKGRVPEGVEGVARLHEMVSAHAEEPSEVVVGIELDRGLLVGALVASGYAVHAINPVLAAEKPACPSARSPPEAHPPAPEIERHDNAVARTTPAIPRGSNRSWSARPKPLHGALAHPTESLLRDPL